MPIRTMTARTGMPTRASRLRRPAAPMAGWAEQTPPTRPAIHPSLRPGASPARLPRTSAGGQGAVVRPTPTRTGGDAQALSRRRRASIRPIPEPTATVRALSPQAMPPAGRPPPPPVLAGPLGTAGVAVVRVAVGVTVAVTVTE